MRVHSSSIFSELSQQTHDHRGDISSGSAQLQREFIGKPAAIYLEQHYQSEMVFNFCHKWEVKVVSAVRKTFVFLYVFTVCDLMVMDYSFILVVSQYPTVAIW